MCRCNTGGRDSQANRKSAPEICLVLFTLLLATTATASTSEESRSCDALALQLRAADNSTAEAAFNKLLDGRDEAISCLISLLNESDEYSGPCGLQSQMLHEGPEGLRAVEKLWGRRPMVSEVALYAVLAIIQRNRYFANCWLEEETGSLEIDSGLLDVALDEIATLHAEKSWQHDEVAVEEILAILERHGLRFHGMQPNE